MISWFEIPVANMQRAKGFYETVFNVKISVHDFGNLLMGWFPIVEGKAMATGTLIQHDTYTPQ